LQRKDCPSFFNAKELLIFGIKIIEMRTDKIVILNELSNLLRARFEDNLKDVALFGSIRRFNF